MATTSTTPPADMRALLGKLNTFSTALPLRGQNTWKYTRIILGVEKASCSKRAQTSGVSSTTMSGIDYTRNANRRWQCI